MTDQPYTPPRVWQWEQTAGGGRFANINRPVAGATHVTVEGVGAGRVPTDKGYRFFVDRLAAPRATI